MPPYPMQKVFFKDVRAKSCAHHRMFSVLLSSLWLWLLLLPPPPLFTRFCTDNFVP